MLAHIAEKSGGPNNDVQNNQVRKKGDKNEQE
jgi:hypothetical protein